MKTKQFGYNTGMKCGMKWGTTVDQGMLQLLFLDMKIASGHSSVCHSHMMRFPDRSQRWKNLMSIIQPWKAVFLSSTQKRACWEFSGDFPDVFTHGLTWLFLQKFSEGFGRKSMSGAILIFLCGATCSGGSWDKRRKGELTTPIWVWKVKVKKTEEQCKHEPCKMSSLEPLEMPVSFQWHQKTNHWDFEELLVWPTWTAYYPPGGPRGEYHSCITVTLTCQFIRYTYLKQKSCHMSYLRYYCYY